MRFSWGYDGDVMEIFTECDMDFFLKKKNGIFM
jgi:hypothetical protein